MVPVEGRGESFVAGTGKAVLLLHASAAHGAVNGIGKITKKNKGLKAVQWDS